LPSFGIRGLKATRALDADHLLVILAKPQFRRCE
jgi:hypothetical protein